ncbi:hypothetical protein F5Y15DRAFT_106355 [Xylariaceae sp. FL0016]|nr:hypothetical protein F5Y15DRAFT_106355 [Xylariaceae sp. FL0016]
MENSLIQQLCRSLRKPKATKRYTDAGIGLLLLTFNQCLVVPIQMLLDAYEINLPASILVMLLAFILMVTASCINQEVVQLYDKHLRGPTDFLGRHMSLGFVVYFVALNRDHITNGNDVSRIAGAFVVTTLMSYVGGFLVASGSFVAEQRIRSEQVKLNNVEGNRKSWPSPPNAWPATTTEKGSKRISQLSTITDIFTKHEPLATMAPISNAMNSSLIDFIICHFPSLVVLLLLISVGIPVVLATGYSMPFEAACFLLFWVLAIQFQRSLRNSYTLHRYSRTRSTLIVLANPVVLTSALGSVYLWTKTAWTNQSIDTVIGNFRCHSSLAQSFSYIMKEHIIAPHLGPGDLAGPILDAGIVCLGLKMYEYRAELCASFGTVFSTCTCLAAVNVFLNVLVAHATGLQSRDAIAFAGRSATVALSVSAMENLGGSITLMSALAIFSGVLFQISGDWLFAMFHINDRRVERRQEGMFRSNIVLTGDVEKGDVGRTLKKQSLAAHTEENGREDTMVVAAGVTVGINAAAMGTAFLIERDSRATAYSALSMTVFGAMTVAMSALPGAAEAVGLLTSR